MGIARLTKDPAATPIACWVSAPPDGAIHTEPHERRGAHAFRGAFLRLLS